MGIFKLILIAFILIVVFIIYINLVDYDSMNLFHSIITFTLLILLIVTISQIIETINVDKDIREVCFNNNYASYNNYEINTLTNEFRCENGKVRNYTIEKYCDWKHCVIKERRAIIGGQE